MRRSLSILFVMSVSLPAFAGVRQLISCAEKEVAKADQIKVSLNFDPSVSRDTIWAKDDKGRPFVKTYVAGDAEGELETTARVTVTIPKTRFRGYSGRVAWSDFYDINTFEEAGSGYSYKFGGGPYRAFHGHDRDLSWDMMVYFPDAVSGKAAREFDGLLTMQMDIMDMGYFHIDLTCRARLK